MRNVKYIQNIKLFKNGEIVVTTISPRFQSEGSGFTRYIHSPGPGLNYSRTTRTI